MLHLIPSSLHRRLYRFADRLRKIWWRITKPQLRAATVIAIDPEGRVLLVRLSYGNGGWSLPIGGIGRGEDPVAAARRELREETGCEAQSLNFLGEEEIVVYGAQNRVYVYSAQISGASSDIAPAVPSANMREVIAAEFFPLHSLPEPLSQMAKKRLELWQERELEAKSGR